MSNDFIQSRTFEVLANKGRRIVSNYGVWALVFDAKDDALSFARYISGYVRRVVVGARTDALVAWSTSHNAFAAELSIQFPGWGCETGRIVFTGQKVGILVGRGSAPILLPIKPYRFVAKTESGSLYIGFVDGSAFCRSKTDGAMPLAAALFFAPLDSEARLAHERGGEVVVTDLPAPGFYPIYTYKSSMASGKYARLKLQPGAFRIGTSVVEVTYV